MTLYLTFSRGAIWVLPVGFVLYVLLAQPRGLLTALPAAGIPAAIAAKVAYGNELLARADYDSSAAAASQGRHVALVVLACAVGAADAAGGGAAAGQAPGGDPDRARAAAAAARRASRSGSSWRSAIGAVVADAPRRIADARATFSEGRYMDYSSDLRSRLTSAVDNGRIDNWRVALDGFDEQPLHGTGAGTYRITWDRYRAPPPVKVNDGHSLYLETLSELGVVGLVLLLVMLGTILGAGVARLGGPERHAHGAFVAAGTMLALHAAIDWDWEMPALFVWLFGAGGVALAARELRRVAASESRLVAASERSRARATRGSASSAGCRAWPPRSPCCARPHAGAVRLLAAAAGPRRHGLRAARLRDRDRRGADRHRALRHAPGAVADPRLLRRAAGPVRARPARDGRRPLARSRTTGSSPTARRSSTASRASTRGPTPRRRCG